MELLLRGTIWISLLSWVVAEWRRSPGAPTSGRTAWTIGAAAAVVHSALAFHLRHGWSHDAAWADTARQTAAVFGFDWGGGVFFNYAFLILWTADAHWWHARPVSFASRPRAVDAFVRGFLWFMFLNGAVVFVPGWRRAVGAAAVLAVAVAWYRRGCSAARPITAG